MMSEAKANSITNQVTSLFKTKTFWPDGNKAMQKDIYGVRHKGHAGEKIVVIGSHPDDYEIAIGMLILDYVNKGNKVYGIVCSDGEKSDKDHQSRRDEAQKAAEMFGLEDVYFLGFPDTKLHAYRNDLIQEIEKILGNVNPFRVYTHIEADRHQDHRTVSEVVKIAGRKIPSLYLFSSLSILPEAAFQEFFLGNNVYMEKKLGIISAAYNSQINNGSIVNYQRIKSNAIHFGMFVDPYRNPPALAEPLKVCQNIRHYVPTNNSITVKDAEMVK